jgi:hypothetical protein
MAMRSTLIVVLLSILAANAFSQPAQTDTPVRYGFVKGREYVYNAIFRQLDETESREHAGDSYAHRWRLHVCVGDVDSSGSAELLFTVTDDRHEAIEGLDASSLSGMGMTRRPDIDPKYTARISAFGDFKSGKILEEAQFKLKARAMLEPGDVLYMSPDSSLLKEYLRTSFPLLPNAARSFSAPLERAGTAHRSITWFDEDGRKLTSVLRDSSSDAGGRFNIFESTYDTEHTAALVKRADTWKSMTMRTIFRAADGVLVQWKRLTEVEMDNGGSNTAPDRYWGEEVFMLEEEKPCTP